jgi:uncharacterized membrane protein
MSWVIAGDWLAVLGLLFLTTGTAAQAWANLSEFESLRQTISQAASNALAGRATHGSLTGISVSVPVGFLVGRRRPRQFSVLKIPLLILLRPAQLARIRTEGGDEAVQLAQFLRQAEVWGIIMIGSALGLAAAVIQLVLA